MQYSLTLDLLKLGEWNLNPAQGCLVSFLTQAATWAQPIVIEGTVWYWCSKTKILEELGTIFNTKDTVYRNVKILQEKGIINYRKLNEMDLFNLSEKGKQWLKKDNDFDLGKNSEPRKNIRMTSEKNPSNLGKNSDISYNQDQYTNNHTPLTPQGAEAGGFDEIFKLYTTAPTGCVAGRASDYGRSKREFKKLQDVNASELVEIIKAFWQHDDAWRRGYQPSLARFLAEKQFRNKPQAPRQQAQAPQRATAYLTPEQEIAKEQERKAIEKQRNLKIVADFEQGRTLSSDEFKGLYETNRRKSHEYLMALCSVDFNRYQELVGALKS